MNYLEALLVSHASIIAALLVAPWATSSAAGMRLSIGGMAKYVAASLIVFYVLGFALDTWWNGAALIAMLVSQLLLGACWFPRCVEPRPAKPQGRRGWRWWAPPMLALFAEISFELISMQAGALMLKT